MTEACKAPHLAPGEQLARWQRMEAAMAHNTAPLSSGMRQALRRSSTKDGKTRPQQTRAEQKR